MSAKRTYKHKKSNRILKCTACSKGSDAEVLHPYLKVPICGSCFLQLKDADKTIEEQQEIYCIWCGFGDGCELFMCDTCIHGFCTDCISRNFGQTESTRVRALEIWSCYLCSPTKQSASLIVGSEVTFFNIDKAYDEVRPPKVLNSEIQQLVNEFSKEEKTFAWLFSSYINEASLSRLNIIGDYLKATDIMPIIFRISKRLRLFFKLETLIIPGLFRTPYGIENSCHLYQHQMISLHCMMKMENQDENFGSLRGGIFGDEPGLGKTVTAMALVASTAGLLPQQPKDFWNEDAISEQWIYTKGVRKSYLQKILNKIQRTEMRLKESEELDESSPSMRVLYSSIRFDIITSYIEDYESIEEFERAVKLAILYSTMKSHHKLTLQDLFKTEMNQVRENLDKSKRSIQKSKLEHDRIKWERVLIPSGATLIVVPLELLEHWYEQLKLHLDLRYFTKDTDERGVVYLDGLGDMADIDTHLPKFEIKELLLDPSVLSSYLIVVTTFERCYLDLKRLVDRKGGVSIARNAMGKQFESSIDSVVNDPDLLYSAAISDKGHTISSFLKIRWLRLIIDEGHELGRITDSSLGLIVNEHKKIKSTTQPRMNLIPAVTNGIVLENGLEVNPAPSVAAAVRTTPKQSKKSSSLMLKNALITRFIFEIAAERRWVMSGTPTTGANSQLGLEQLHRLLRFLRYPEYGCNAIRDDRNKGHGQWKSDIITKCLRQQPEAWNKVDFLLKKVLVRHRKSNLELFEPVRRVVNLFPINEMEDGDDDHCGGNGNDGDDEDRGRTFDRTIARYIVDKLAKARSEWKRQIRYRVDHNQIVRKEFTPCKTLETIKLSRQQSSNDMKIENSPTKQAPLMEESPQKTKQIEYVNDAKAWNHMQVVNVPEDFKLNGRRPKAIVFSQNFENLQGVGHFLYTEMGDSSICEHWGVYKSSELSRFRHSKRRYRLCPICGYHNDVTSGSHCQRVLVQIEYSDVETLSDDHPLPDPQPAGHGYFGSGGHYNGLCYCHPHSPVYPCGSGHCYPNALYTKNPMENPNNRNFAFVAEDHIRNINTRENIYAHEFRIGMEVYVIPLEGFRKSCSYHELSQETTCSSMQPTDVTDTDSANTPSSSERNSQVSSILWKGGIMGGRATIIAWKKCCGMSGWHGGCQKLSSQPWNSVDEDASILLLTEDGSTGLDLSYATHIFLLERIKDPALYTQIVSRAHRMGATGSVLIELIQVKTKEAAEAELKLIEDMREKESNRNVSKGILPDVQTGKRKMMIE